MCAKGFCIGTLDVTGGLLYCDNAGFWYNLHCNVLISSKGKSCLFEVVINHILQGERQFVWPLSSQISSKEIELYITLQFRGKVFL